MAVQVSDGLTASGWPVATRRGDAVALHAAAAALVAAPGPARRSAQVLHATRRCVVLGSTQPPSTVDAGRLAAAGLCVAQRRSGGAAVMVGPGEVLWVDVVLPAGDRLWVDDVHRSSWWLGALWADALRRAGQDAQAWQGPLVRTPWSSQVCFAGLGPGEVTVGGRKVLGLSQRRTRAGALFQCALLVRWQPAELLDVLDLSEEARAEGAGALAGVAAGLGPAVAAAVVDDLLARLPAS